MSADLWIKFEACETCGRGAECGAELNVTYNLSGMLREGGFNGWDWCTRSSSITNWMPRWLVWSNPCC